MVSDAFTPKCHPPISELKWRVHSFFLPEVRRAQRRYLDWREERTGTGREAEGCLDKPY